MGKVETLQSKIGCIEAKLSEMFKEDFKYDPQEGNATHLIFDANSYTFAISPSSINNNTESELSKKLEKKIPNCEKGKVYVLDTDMIIVESWDINQ
ncbi:hypothetical protein BZJ19_16925 [Salinivibrio proteolyticus]|uniref:hypothetical protein n=1 Tax=Salinivibrio proteolyticus TaxID=334715 RepID=UPI000988A5D8|nr:hypothetical protein [Salinivibrio proteolyticus]OOF20862.1 hypothetical protein BZJ19_16925 [Salinivibrio proteolyticus]